VQKQTMPKSAKHTQELIDVFDNGNLKEWCLKLHCERNELITAVLNAGKHPKQVKDFLKAKKLTK
jgi:hypothetical protein